MKLLHSEEQLKMNMDTGEQPQKLQNVLLILWGPIKLDVCVTYSGCEGVYVYSVYFGTSRADMAERGISTAE